MYAILGGYKFKDYKGFQELNTSDEMAYSQHPVIEGKPRLQATGEKLREIVIKFLLHSTYSDPDSDIELLQGYRRRAEIVEFLSGSGVSFGNFVVTKVESGVVQTDKKGAVIGVDVAVYLLEAVSPNMVKATDTIATKTPGLVIKALPPKISDARLMSQKLKIVNSQSAAIVKDLSYAARVAAAVDRAFRTTKKRIDAIKSALVSIEKVGNETQKIANVYNSAKGQVQQVNNATESLAAFVNGGDLNSAVNASTALRNQVNILNVDTAPINNLTTLRQPAEYVASL